jgi:hypothetical protein
MLLTGRIAGISGIFGGCLGFGVSDKAWRSAFIAGLILAPLTASWVGYAVPSSQMPASWTVIIAAGLLHFRSLGPKPRRCHDRGTGRLCPWFQIGASP